MTFKKFLFFIQTLFIPWAKGNEKLSLPLYAHNSEKGNLPLINFQGQSPCYPMVNQFFKIYDSTQQGPLGANIFQTSHCPAPKIKMPFNPGHHRLHDGLTTGEHVFFCLPLLPLPFHGLVMWADFHHTAAGVTAALPPCRTIPKITAAINSDVLGFPAARLRPLIS